MKTIFTIISCLAMSTMGGHELDPDTWFAAYDDDYLTSVEILGHRYIVKVLAHDVLCPCKNAHPRAHKYYE